MEFTQVLWDVIRTELEDVVGVENVRLDQADLITHGNDTFWLTQQYVNKGQAPTLPKLVVLAVSFLKSSVPALTKAWRLSSELLTTMRLRFWTHSATRFKFKNCFLFRFLKARRVRAFVFCDEGW